MNQDVRKVWNIVLCQIRHHLRYLHQQKYISLTLSCELATWVVSSGSILPLSFPGTPLRLEELADSRGEVCTLFTHSLHHKSWNNKTGQLKRDKCSVTLTGKESLEFTHSFIQQIFIKCLRNAKHQCIWHQGYSDENYGVFPALCSLQERRQIIGKWKYMWYMLRIEKLGSLWFNHLLFTHWWERGSHPRDMKMAELRTHNTESMRSAIVH